MESKAFKQSRTLLIACFTVLFLLATGCTQHPPRPPLSADEVKTLSAEFDRISSLHIAAWNNHDLNPMRQLYTEDILYYETGPTPQNQGSDIVIPMLMQAVMSGDSKIEVHQAGTFIGRGTGFDIWNLLGDPNDVWIGMLAESKGILAPEYNLYSLREGKIAEWWVDWGSAYWEAIGTKILEKPLQEYATAWSSGNPKKVASLYDPKAVRTDTLYGENEQGSSAIKDFAANFFAWYPGVRLELQKSFELYMLEVGGVYAIHVTDQAGKPCDVSAIILLDLKKNQNTNEFDMITNERVFYKPDTLLACGWAR